MISTKKICKDYLLLNTFHLSSAVVRNCIALLLTEKLISSSQTIQNKLKYHTGET